MTPEENILSGRYKAVRRSYLQFVQIIANSSMLLVVILPVGPLLHKEGGQRLEGGGGQIVGVLLHAPHHLLGFVDKSAPALRHQAPGQLHFVHLLGLVVHTIFSKSVLRVIFQRK